MPSPSGSKIRRAHRASKPTPPTASITMANASNSRSASTIRNKAQNRTNCVAIWVRAICPSPYADSNNLLLTPRSMLRSLSQSAITPWGCRGLKTSFPLSPVPTASYTSTKNNAPSSLRNRQMHSSRQVLSNWQKCNNMQAQCRRQMRNNRRLHSKWQVRNNRQMRRNPSKPMSAKS